MLIRLFLAAFLAGVSSAWAAPSVDTLRYSTDLFAVFDVSKAAGEAEFRASYRKLLMQYHPDRNPGDRQAEEISKRLNQLMSDLKHANFKAAQVAVKAPARPAKKAEAPPPPPTPKPAPPPEPPPAPEPPKQSAHGAPAGDRHYYDYAYARRAYQEAESFKEGPEPAARNFNQQASPAEAAHAYQRSSGNSCADRYSKLYREI